MPTIPQRIDRPRQGGFLAAPRVTPPANVTGRQITQLGQAIQGAGLDVAEEGYALNERIQLSVFKRAQALAEEKIQDARHHYLGLVGAQATGKARARMWETLQSQLRDIQGGLEDPLARNRFEDVVMTRRMLSERDRWGAHEREQSLVEEIGVRTALTEKKAAAAIGDPGQLGSLRMEARALGAAKGLGKEGPQSDLFVQGYTEKVHTAVVSGLVDNDRATDAAEYLSKIPEKDISPQVRQELQKVVRRGGDREKGVSLADQALDQAYAQFDKRREQELRESGFDDIITDEDIGFPAPGELSAIAAGILEDQHRKGEFSVQVRDIGLGELKRIGANERQRFSDAQAAARLEGERWLQQPENQFKGVWAMPPSMQERFSRLGVTSDLNLFALHKGRYPTNEEFLFAVTSPDGGGFFEMPFEEFKELVRTNAPAFSEEILALYAKARGTADDKQVYLATKATYLKEAAYDAGILTRGATRESEEALADYERFRNHVEDLARAEPEQRAVPKKDVPLDRIRELAAQAGDDLFRFDPGFWSSEVQAPWGTLREEEASGLDDEEAAAVAAGTKYRPTGVGAFITSELMTDYFTKYIGSVPPLVVASAEDTYIGDIGTDAMARMGRKIRKENAIRREMGLREIPVSETAKVIWWLIAQDEDRKAREGGGEGR